jgi:hypothetical protein
MHTTQLQQEFGITSVTGFEAYKSFRSAYSRTMSAPHNYGHWATTDMRGNNQKRQSAGSAGHRATDADESMTYSVDTMHNQFPGHLSGGSSVVRPTSSLAGAMDESALSVAGGSQTPTPVWDSTQVPQANMTDPLRSPYFADAGATAGYLYKSASSRNQSPESFLSASSSGSQPHFIDQFSAAASQQTSDALGLAASGSYHRSSPSEDLARLREKIRELEQECRRSKAEIDTLRGYIGTPRLPNLQPAWDMRTEARKKIYCSLNRAGNALCAWHDSRRERRKYPPRNAPPGFLNCGCTHEQALFEESLSRHGVGNYHPGEAVRMDPALRNPLLELLQRRYGYKDGDFDLDPVTESWMRGQSAEDWQRSAREGKVIKART